MKKSVLNILLFFVCSFTLNAQSDTTIVLLSEIDSTIVQDVKYATTDNFTGIILYPTGKVYLRKVVAEKLSAANKFALDKFGYSIKIFDGYRPRSVQYKMWEVYPNPNYVADPKKGQDTIVAPLLILLLLMPKEMSWRWAHHTIHLRRQHIFPHPKLVKQHAEIEIY